MYALPNAKEIILEYVMHGGRVSDDYQDIIFELPNAPEVVLEYARHHPLCKNVKAEISKLPNAEEIFTELKKFA